MEEGNLLDEGTLMEDSTLLEEGTLQEWTLQEGTLLEGSLQECSLQEGALQDGRGGLFARTAYFFPGARGRGGPSPGHSALFLFRRLFCRETSVPVIKAQHDFPTAIIFRRSGEIFRRSLFSDGQVKFPTQKMGPDFSSEKGS